MLVATLLKELWSCIFFAEKDAPSVYKKRDVFIFLKFHL